MTSEAGNLKSHNTTAGNTWTDQCNSLRISAKAHTFAKSYWNSQKSCLVGLVFWGDIPMKTNCSYISTYWVALHRGRLLYKTSKVVHVSVTKELPTDPLDWLIDLLNRSLLESRGEQCLIHECEIILKRWKEMDSTQTFFYSSCSTLWVFCYFLIAHLWLNSPDLYSDDKE